MYYKYYKNIYLTCLKKLNSFIKHRYKKRKKMIIILTNIVYTIEFHRKYKTDIWNVIGISIYYWKYFTSYLPIHFVEYYNVKNEK